MREWERWRSFWGACGARGSSKAVFEILDRGYREPQRFYHTWEHVMACLAELEGARHLCRDPVAVELALWCHDSVHDPREKDNETRSAAIASRAAADMGLGETVAAEAEALVRATTHAREPVQGSPWAADAQVVLDIDLAILGRPSREFAIYERDIRAEYSFLPDEDYQQGRSRLLESLLRRPRIYLTGLFGEKFERQARVNIQESLERLSSAPRRAVRSRARRRG